MAGNDLKMNKLSYNVGGAMSDVKRFVDGALDACADKLVEIFKHEIQRIGNGDSQFMRPDAAKQVRKIVHEVCDDKINFEVGIDEDALKGMSEEIYVRVMVVIHGNMAEGKPLYTKPGQMTYKKYVKDKSMAPEWMDRYALPIEFSQYDKVEYIVRNSMKQIEKYYKDALNAIDQWLDGDFWGKFIEVR